MVAGQSRSSVIKHGVSAWPRNPMVFSQGIFPGPSDGISDEITSNWRDSSNNPAGFSVWEDHKENHHKSIRIPQFVMEETLVSHGKRTKKTSWTNLSQRYPREHWGIIQSKNVGIAGIAIRNPPFFDGWNTTHVWGMVYDIAIPTLLKIYPLVI